MVPYQGMAGVAACPTRQALGPPCTLGVPSCLHRAGQDPGPLGRYATALGLAFQIADDILDIEGDADKAGKRLRKDAGAGKATFVSLLGMDGAKTRARALVAEAEAALLPYGARAETLVAAAEFVIARER